MCDVCVMWGLCLRQYIYTSHHRKRFIMIGRLDIMVVLISDVIDISKSRYYKEFNLLAIRCFRSVNQIYSQSSYDENKGMWGGEGVGRRGKQGANLLDT